MNESEGPSSWVNAPSCSSRETAEPPGSRVISRRSSIANHAAGIAKHALNHLEVIEAGGRAAEPFRALLERSIKHLAAVPPRSGEGVTGLLVGVHFGGHVSCVFPATFIQCSHNSVIS